MLSWWNSLESVSNFNWWMQFAVTVFGVLTALSGGLAWVSGNRLSSLQADKEAGLLKRVAAAEERQRPRSLTAQQRARAVEILRASPKGVIEVVSLLGDTEGQSFAEELKGVLREVGWTVHSGQIAPVAPTYGLTTEVINDASPQPPALALKRALDELGFSTALSVLGDPRGEYKRVRLTVGAKP